MQRARERKPGQPSSVAVDSTSRQAREAASAVSMSRTRSDLVDRSNNSVVAIGVASSVITSSSSSRQVRRSTSHTGEDREDQMGTSSGGQMKGTTERL
jgi:hypothetical protein